MAAELATKERERFSELENVIEAKLLAFIEVGLALAEIRDRRFYRETHDTFGAYLRERWNLSRAYAHRQIEAAQVAVMLPIGNRPANEAQARELARLRDDPEELRRVWDDVTAAGEEVTAAVVKEAIRRVDRRRAQDEKAFQMALSRGSNGGGSKPPARAKDRPPVRATPAAVEAHDRAQAASDEIRLVLGPWTSEGKLPEHRRVPEPAFIADWRRQLAQNGNGSNGAAPQDLRKIIASVKKLRASLPADSPAHAALTRALDALAEVA